MRAFDYVVPSNLQEAIALLAKQGDRARVLSGGTDLIVQVRERRRDLDLMVDVKKIPELLQVRFDPKTGLTLGASVSCARIYRDPQIARIYPGLIDAASLIGGIQIQNRASLGGNVCNASPAADSPPALLAYDAELELISKAGTRKIPYAKFHRGYKQMDLRADELVTAIHLPRAQQTRMHYYRKVGTRKAQAISKVCFAGVAEIANHTITRVRIALGSVAPIPIRCEQTEAALDNQPLNDETIKLGVATLASEIAPIDDIRSTRDYRLRVSLNLLQDFLRRGQ